MEDHADAQAARPTPSGALAGYLWYFIVDGVPIPLGWHSDPNPQIPGVEVVRMPGVFGNAARAIAKGEEAIGNLIPSIPIHPPDG